MSYNLKDMVAGDRRVHFEFFRKGELWYKTDCGFEFPVPAEDTGDGTFLASDRAMLFMRYIRKQLENIEKGKQYEANDPYFNKVALLQHEAGENVKFC